MAKKLSIIIPRYVHSLQTDLITNHTIEQVFNVADRALDTKVYVVDNGSSLPFTLTDDLIDYHRWDSNLGIAPAWNEGWRRAGNSDFLCWLNADCVVRPGWDKALCIAAEQLDCIAMPYTNGVKSDGVGITGWCFLTSRYVATRVGPFDETFVPVQYEDTDWFYRAIQMDHPLVNVPAANVLHERKAGGTKDAPWYGRFHLIHMANRYRFAWKHNLSVEEPPAFWQHPLPDVELDDVGSEVRPG